MRPSPKILVVEDDEDDLFFVQRALNKAGVAELYHVKDGQLAMDYLTGQGAFSNRVLHPFPNIILVDLKIPHVDGHQLVEWIGRQEELKELKVYVLSSSGENRDRNRASRSGATGYFVKPLTAADCKTIR